MGVPARGLRAGALKAIRPRAGLSPTRSSTDAFVRADRGVAGIAQGREGRLRCRGRPLCVAPRGAYCVGLIASLWTYTWPICVLQTLLALITWPPTQTFV